MNAIKITSRASILLHNPSFTAWNHILPRNSSFSASKKNKTEPVKKMDLGDKRLITIKDMLYGPDPNTKALEAQQSSMVGEQSEKQIQHQNDVDLVERVWFLEKQAEYLIQTEQVRAEHEAIYNAMEKLKEYDYQLFELALVNPGIDTFPARFRIPTDTVSVLGWDYHMDRLA